MSDSDLQRFFEISEEFFAAVIEAYPSWLQRSVTALPGAAEIDGLDGAVAEATRTVSDGLGQLLTAHPDEYRTNPLSILRNSISPVTGVLTEAGVAPVQRDVFLVEQFPEDVFGLSPANFGELGEQLTAMGIAWGAARAYLHIQSHQ